MICYDLTYISIGNTIEEMGLGLVYQLINQLELETIMDKTI